jgi:hypothetical protein
MPLTKVVVLSGVACVVTSVPPQLTAASLTALAETRLSFDVANRPVPRWSSGRLLVIDNPRTSRPSILVLDRNGIQESAAAIVIPGAERVWVDGFSRGGDGTLVGTGWAADSQGRAALYMAVLPPKQGTPRVIRTEPYHACATVVADDGSIWTAGVEALKDRPAGDPDPNAPYKPFLASGVIRHFDARGGQLGSFIPQRTIQDLVAVQDSTTYLAAAGNRVAWYCSRERRYVEIGSDGTVLDIGDIQSPTAPEFSAGFALANNGRAFLATRDGGSGNHWICELDKQAKKWVPVWSEKGFVGLYGTDGNTLVTTMKDRFTLRFLDASQ